MLLDILFSHQFFTISPNNHTRQVVLGFWFILRTVIFVSYVGSRWLNSILTETPMKICCRN